MRVLAAALRAIRLRLCNRRVGTVALCALLSPAGYGAAFDLPSLERLAADDAQVSALIVELQHNRPLAALNPQARLTPASLSKLYTTAAALERWGPNHRFTTRFMSSARPEDGVLRGDLVYLGAGDPDMGSERLLALITRLRQAGVLRIEGNLVINNSLYGHVPCVTQDRCEAQRHSRFAFDAPLSAAGVDFSTVEILVNPGPSSGRAASLTITPGFLDGYSIDGTVNTVPANRRASFSAHRRSNGHDDRLLVQGQIPVGHPPLRLSRSVGNAELHAGRMITALLAQNGILYDGAIIVDDAPPAASLSTLAQIDSSALAEQLRTMMRFSNNYMADLLTLNLLAYADERPQALTLPGASRLLERLAFHAIDDADLAREARILAGSDPLVLDSGSGLTVSSLLSAHDVVSLLASMYRRSDLFPSFYGTLTVPDFAHQRMLQEGNADFFLRMAVKTGTLTEPRSVRSLAGYLRLRNGGWAAFAVIINGTEKRPSIPGPDMMHAIREDLERIMALR